MGGGGVDLAIKIGVSAGGAGGGGGIDPSAVSGARLRLRVLQ